MKKIINSVEFILLKDDKILVEKRKITKRIDPGKICIPGGGIEKNETSEEALWRECEEEFGIKITEYFFIDRLIYKHDELDFWLNYFVVTKWEGKIQNLEAEKLLWINRFNPKELDLGVDKKAVKLLNKLEHKKILAIIKSEKDNYLLLRTNKRYLQVDNWYVVSGGLDKGETYKDACKREIKEETGLKTITLKETNKYYKFEWPKGSGINHKERLMFAVVKENKPKLSVEHIDYVWLPKDQFVKKIYWYSDKKDLIQVLNKF